MSIPVFGLAPGWGSNSYFETLLPPSVSSGKVLEHPELGGCPSETCPGCCPPPPGFCSSVAFSSRGDGPACSEHGHHAWDNQRGQIPGNFCWSPERSVIDWHWPFGTRTGVARRDLQASEAALSFSSLSQGKMAVVRQVHPLRTNKTQSLRRN